MTAGVILTEDDLVAQYRTLYWQLNELQLCGVSWQEPEYAATEQEMREISQQLGFRPEC